MRSFYNHFSKQSEVKTYKYAFCKLLNITIKNGAWSDDWAYWQFDYPGFIVTDMAYLRSPRYHRNDDTIENINFPEFTKVVWRLRSSVVAFADGEF